MESEGIIIIERAISVNNFRLHANLDVLLITFGHDEVQLFLIRSVVSSVPHNSCLAEPSCRYKARHLQDRVSVAFTGCYSCSLTFFLTEAAAEVEIITSTARKIHRV